MPQLAACLQDGKVNMDLPYEARPECERFDRRCRELETQAYLRSLYYAEHKRIVKRHMAEVLQSRKKGRASVERNAKVCALMWW